MRTLYVIRHAEPLVANVLLGRHDPPLSDAGRRQASELPPLEHAALYSSPLRRALETARYFSPEPILTLKFTEISYGSWDGLSWREIERQWPEMAVQKLRDWRGTTPPGGETWQEFRDRVLCALTAVLAGPHPAVIVAHQAVNSIIAEHLTREDSIQYRQAYCEIKRYDV